MLNLSTVAYLQGVRKSLKLRAKISMDKVCMMCVYVCKLICTFSRKKVHSFQLILRGVCDPKKGSKALVRIYKFLFLEILHS